MKTTPAAAFVIVQLVLAAGSGEAQQQRYSARTLEENGRRIEAQLTGEVEFTDDSRAIESISPDGRFVMEESGPGIPTRRVEIVPRAGALERSYSSNGVRQPLDAAAESWLSDTLRTLIRGTSTVSVAESSSSSANASRSSAASASVEPEPDETPRCTCPNTPGR